MKLKIILFLMFLTILSGCIENGLTNEIDNSINNIGNIILYTPEKESLCIKNVVYRTEGLISKLPVEASYNIDEQLQYDNNSDVVKYVNHYVIGTKKEKNYPINSSPYSVVRITVKFDEPLDYFGIQIYKITDVYVCNPNGDII
jgi:hypothetical protein